MPVCAVGLRESMEDVSLLLLNNSGKWLNLRLRLGREGMGLYESCIWTVIWPGRVKATWLKATLDNGEAGPSIMPPSHLPHLQGQPALQVSIDCKQYARELPVIITGLCNPTSELDVFKAWPCNILSGHRRVLQLSRPGLISRT